MATQSALGKFFKVGAAKGASPSDAPPPPKRAAEENGSDAKRRRESWPEPACTADTTSASLLPSQPATQEVREAAVAIPPQPENLTDLRAALQHTRGLPVFTAECIHHYTTAPQYHWPYWLKPENLMDGRGKRPGEPGFDPGSLTVPSEKVQKDEGHGTPMLLQYWQVKKQHFDKIALFKVGKFYEVFYYDAFVAHHVCNLKWMNKEKKPHVGFPEMGKHAYAKQLVDAGYKVVVVEQTERVEENKQRRSDENLSSTPASTCIERKACEVFTKGTVVDPEMIGGADAKYMIYFHFEEGEQCQGSRTAQKEKNFAACLVDCSTSQIGVGRMVDGPDRNALRTLLAQVQPKEVVYASNNLPSEVAMLFKRLPCRPQQSGLRTPELTAMVAKGKLSHYRKAHPGKLTAVVEAAITGEGGSSVAIAAAGALEYLEEVMLSNRVLPFAVWDTLDMAAPPNITQEQQPALTKSSSSSSTTFGRRMVLDATALSALEMLETLEGSYRGSLLDFLDHTSTPFGFRFLKQWVCAPLLDVGEIHARREAIEYFIVNPGVAQKLRDSLKGVDTDLERSTARVWGYALQNERQAVMYSDITAKRLEHFAELLGAYDKCRVLLTSAFNGQALPRRLQQITKTRGDGGNFPDLKDVIERLRTSVVTTPSKNNTVKYRPRDGADPQYDALGKEIDRVKKALDKELDNVKAKLPGKNLVYTHRLVGYRYEIEADEGAIPDKLIQQFDITGKVKGKVKFQTSEIKTLLAKLDSLEDKLEDCIWPFLSKLFQEFYAHQAQFRAAASLVAELDALLSLAAASQGLPGASCTPEFVESASSADPGTLELRSCQHPVAAAKMGAAFVPNDTVMNACGVPGVLVVTGPNMGGKSTVLRQTCIAVVMAQLGCRVNASKCRLSPVDRIFTRIGSYDTILEGKSTLLTELEETAAILAHGTPRSLAVIDELGRGTSTFDGAAIAAAVLEDIAERVSCMTLFATHYHPVSREAAQWKNASPFHMAARLDEVTQEMTFLYRFLPGLCPASHGHNVARLAGLPEAVVKEAALKSAEFEMGSDEKALPAHLSELVSLAVENDDAGLRALFRQTRGVTAH